MPTPEKQDIDALRKRFDKLRDQRTTAQANLKSAEDTLAKLKAEALEKYGSDDPAELQRQLDDLRAENERKRAEYQEHLDGIDGALKALETGGG